MNAPLDGPLWDKLLAFALPTVEHLARQEVRDALDQLGIDTGPAERMVRLAVHEKYSADDTEGSDNGHAVGRTMPEDVRFIEQQCAQAEKLLCDVTASCYAVVGINLEGLIVSWTLRAEHLYGYSTAETHGKTINILSPPDGLKELEGIMETIYHGESVKPLRTVRVRKDGKRFTTSIGFYPVKNTAGQGVGTLTVACLS
jgi:PAS domain S-box-containing protein